LRSCGARLRISSSWTFASRGGRLRGLRNPAKDPGFKNLPIILISGNRGDREPLQGLRAGADDYLTKPLSEELLLKMQRILERNRDRDVLVTKAECSRRRSAATATGSARSGPISRAT